MRVGVGIVGFGWMGRVHARAFQRVAHHYPEVGRPELVAVADDVPGRAGAAAEQFGFARAVLDWRELVGDPAIRVVSVTAPNFLHREMGVAFASAGQHLWIEKPVGVTAADAEAVARAASGVTAAVGFNYRQAPAVEKARKILKKDQIGTVTHARFRLFSDYAAHPEGALSWRFERERGGSGVLADLGSHGVDLVRFLLGDIDALVADTAIFVPERPRAAGATSGHERGTGPSGPVENDDYFGCLLRTREGARVVLECSRVAVGEQNSYGFEIHGTRGALFWDFRRMGELGVCTGPAYQDEPVHTVFADPLDGDFGRFQPGAANPMSYDDLKVIEAGRLLQVVSDGKAVSDGSTPIATLADAVAAARALEAMQESARTGAWVTLPPAAAARTRP